MIENRFRGSCYADADAARRAVELALPTIEQALRQPGVCELGFLAVCVVDPALGPADASFDEAVLHEHAVGDRTRWDADYAAFARAKARTSWRLGDGGTRVQEEGAHRLRAGDSLLAGAVRLDGIVVGVSGAAPWWDEAFAACIAACLRAVAGERRAAARAAGQVAAG